MFDIGWTELVVIGVVALIVIGPRELPATLRTIGQMLTKVRRMASEFQGQFNEALREAELDELRKEAEKLTSGVNFDPLEKVKSEIEAAVEAPAKTESAAVPADAAPDQVEPAQPVKEATAAEAPVEAGGGGRAA